MLHRGVIDTSIFTHGMITVTGNPPEEVINYGACLNINMLTDAPITKDIYAQTSIFKSFETNAPVCKDIYAIAPIVKQIDAESVKIIKKWKLR